MHFCNAYIFLWKMFSVHFTKSNVQHHIFQRKMFSITFDFVKCSASHFVGAEHFPLENVQQSKMLQIHFCKKSKLRKCSAVRCVALPKFILASNAFDAKMHFCNAYILRSQMFSITFYEVKCSASNAFDAEHFPKENVQHHKGAKCSAQHLLRSNVFLNYLSHFYRVKMTV